MGYGGLSGSALFGTRGTTDFIRPFMVSRQILENCQLLLQREKIAYSRQKPGEAGGVFRTGRETGTVFKPGKVSDFFLNY